ncbi:MAG: hypothetical protein ACT4NY_30345, partial [Pseudonocardiales bacterium]
QPETAVSPANGLAPGRNTDPEGELWVTPQVTMQCLMNLYIRPTTRSIQSSSPRVSACGTRYGHGHCTILWIKAQDNEWVLLPHGIPNLAVHLPADDLTMMLNRLRDKL